MAFVHGKDTVVTVDGDPLSAFTNSTAFNRAADMHDTTTYGQDGHTFAAGLTNGTVTITGTFDGAAADTPAVILGTLIASGAAVPFVFQPAGAGAGKPQRSCSVLVASYDETAPVADMVSWSASLQISGAVTITVQV